MLPSLPAALLLAGEHLVQFLRGEKSQVTVRVTGALLLCLVAAGAIYATREPRAVSIACLTLIASPLLIAGVFLVLWRRPRRLSLLVLMCAMLLSTTLAASCLPQLIGERESVRRLMQLAAARGYASAPVYGLHTIEHSAEFYASGRVAHEPDGRAVRFEGPQQILPVAQQQGSPVLVIVPVEHLTQLTAYAPLKTEIIGDNGSVALAVVSVR